MRNSSRHAGGVRDASWRLTRHAINKMHSRSISAFAVQKALEYGRVIHTRGAVHYAIGRKEVQRLGRAGIDLAGLEGLQVVCGQDGAVITTYRNRDFRGLKPTRRRRHSKLHTGGH